MDLLDRLLGHDAWTTGGLLAQSRGLSDEQLDTEFDLGWRTVRAILAHMIGNMEVWTDLMTGVPVRPVSVRQTLDHLEVRLQMVAPQLAILARQIQAQGRWDDTWLDVLDVPPQRKSYGGGITHILTHSMHHRAQLIHMLRVLGVPDVLEGDALSWETEHAGQPTCS